MSKLIGADSARLLWDKREGWDPAGLPRRLKNLAPWKASIL